jgi:hypothetical protein
LTIRWPIDTISAGAAKVVTGASGFLELEKKTKKRCRKAKEKKKKKHDKYKPKGTSPQKNREDMTKTTEHLTAGAICICVKKRRPNRVQFG